jgi:thioredoxin-like negative regulator of GroEL
MGFDIGKRIARIKDYWGELSETERSARTAVLVLVVVALVATPAWFIGRPFWTKWQRDRAIAQMRVFAETGDYRNATLALRRAVTLGANDPAAWREAARLLGEIGSPEVLAAREQVTRLAPHDDQAKLALAADALRFDRPDLAKAALAAIDEAARRDATFYRLAAALAQAAGGDADVERNLEELIAADPNDVLARFNLAALRLWSDDPAEREAARDTLMTLAGDPRARVRAALELLKDAIRQNDQRALRTTFAQLQEKLVPGWRAEFPDTEAAAWTRLSERLKALAAEDGGDASAVLALWLADIGQPREALLWLEGLPAPVRSGADAADAAAELSARLGDLDRVEKYLSAGAWGAWPREILTLALASRVQRLRYSDSAGRATWENAVTAAGPSLPGLRALVRLAGAWADPAGEERALEAIVKRFPATNWACEALKNSYAARRDLPALWQLHETWVRQRPNDRDVALRWIALGCILDHVRPDLVSRAEALQQEESGGASAKIALAAVRWRQRRAADAVRLLSSLPPAEQQQLPALLWLGLAWADLPDRKRAEAALSAAWKNDLSREEMELVRAAARKINLTLPSAGS